ncbi:hypothetical protein E3N88_19987 [Mikania micrantha]|uniref:CoA carboxyltransferase N-terminal domain-containing protein n=1 Tax=Mikania micrantha TaxID=192012 RepID=A0A5N6NIC0_9ASTR|nr:hypothetical protein E3N88_19987 [Mikania micrantha]
MNLCEQCGYHLKMSSSDRIELSIDPGTWEPMDEDMVSLDPIEFHSEEEPYKNPTVLDRSYTRPNTVVPGVAAAAAAGFRSPVNVVTD